MRLRGYNLLRVFVAAVLLTAAALKCHQLATEPIMAGTVPILADTIGPWLAKMGLSPSSLVRWLLMATVEFELFFGVWLLANILPKLTWSAALACFSLFTCISLQGPLGPCHLRLLRPRAGESLVHHHA